MILAKSDPSLERTGRPPRADGRFFHCHAAEWEGLAQLVSCLRAIRRQGRQKSCRSSEDLLSPRAFADPRLFLCAATVRWQDESVVISGPTSRMKNPRSDSAPGVVLCSDDASDHFAVMS